MSEAKRLSTIAAVKIAEAMEAKDIPRWELARRLGLSTRRVDYVLEGKANVTLKTLARFGDVLGVKWELATDLLPQPDLAARILEAKRDRGRT